jgi:hypothetical protein
MPAKSHSKQNAQAEMVYCQGPSPILSFAILSFAIRALHNSDVIFGAGRN